MRDEEPRRPRNLEYVRGLREKMLSRCPQVGRECEELPDCATGAAVLDDVR